MQTVIGYFDDIDGLVLNFEMRQWYCGYVNNSYFLDSCPELLMDECSGSSLK